MTNIKYGPQNRVMSVITTDETSSIGSINDSMCFEEEDTDSSGDNTTAAQDSSVAYICECGKELQSGWQCDNCRRSCPICNRALSNDPDDHCERCFRRCKYHGLYRTNDACHACSKQ